MTGLRPFFKYYGSKHSTSGLFPTPEHKLLVEPFAGSAGYALRHHQRQVVLVEKDPVIAGIWQYLIHADPREILALPDLDPEGSIEDVDAPWSARHLIGFWLNRGGVTHHNYRPSGWMVNWIKAGKCAAGVEVSFWGPGARRRIAAQLSAIRHWRVFHASYADCPDRKATWFIDPPYLGGKSTYRGLGSYYRVNAKTIDYGHLAGWVKSRRGQVIACEGTGASWLDFVRVDERLCTWYRSESQRDGACVTPAGRLFGESQCDGTERRDRQRSVAIEKPQRRGARATTGSR